MNKDDYTSSSEDEEMKDGIIRLVNDSIADLEQVPKKKLPYNIGNCLKHALRVLDSQNAGCLAKTQLQVFCASICNALNLKYNAEDLISFKVEKTQLMFKEFINFIEDNLLVKVFDLNVSFDSFDRFSWTIIEKERNKCAVKILTDEELFQLWKAFNKIDISESGSIDIEEVIILLQIFMQGIGTPWTKAPLDNYTTEIELTFWELVECLESKYITFNNSTNIYKDGLNSIFDHYNLEIVKSGYLVKKGHRIKSMKERWFVLLPDALIYYDGKTKRAKKKGSVAINATTKVEAVQEMKGSRFRFTLNCGIKAPSYEVEASDLKSMNEWISAIQLCIDHINGETPLMISLLERSQERKERREKKAEEDRLRFEHETLIQSQIKELQLLKEERDAAQTQAAVEAALLEDERKRCEELEQLRLEYERLLEAERVARIIESEARVKQQTILEEEMLKRQILEKIKAEQEMILEEEKRVRESLEEISKDQAKALEEERDRLRILDAARRTAEEELKTAHSKLEEAEEERRSAALKVEAAKERARKMNLPVGLARPLVLEQRGVATHRGFGAFIEEDFSKTPLYLSSERRPSAVNKREINEGERAVIVESNLVKPSKSKETFESQ